MNLSNPCVLQLQHGMLSPLDPYLCLPAQQTMISQFSCFPALSSVNFLRVDTLAFLLALIPIYLALRPPQVARVVRPLPAHSLPENIIKFKSLCS